MAEDILHVEMKAPAAILTLNRPDKRNALSIELLDAIRDAMLRAEQTDSIRGVVITGSERFFSTGADLASVNQQNTPLAIGRWLDHFTECNRTIERLSLPVIAAINGYCLTGGLEMALACDIRIAGSGSTYGITSAKIGTVAGAGGTQRLPRIVGIQRAKDMLMSADFYPAEAALQMGLVMEVLEPDEVMPRALERIAAYAERAPLSVWFAKKAVNAGMQMSLESGIEFEQSLIAHLYGTDDRKEGVSAFLEKRTATFKGK